MAGNKPIRDYEDLSGMRLTDTEIAELVGEGGECIFNWTTKDGFPVGVVVAYVFRHGKFWTTCAERRQRVPALRTRPQSAIVINRDGRTVSFKGNSVIHSRTDTDWTAVKTWFYKALSGTERDPSNSYARNFEKFLDSPHRVIIETEVRLIVGFDTARFAKLTAEAIAAGMDADN